MAAPIPGSNAWATHHRMRPIWFCLTSTAQSAGSGVARSMKKRTGISLQRCLLCFVNRSKTVERGRREWGCHLPVSLEQRIALPIPLTEKLLNETPLRQCEQTDCFASGSGGVESFRFSSLGICYFRANQTFSGFSACSRKRMMASKHESDSEYRVNL